MHFDDRLATVLNLPGGSDGMARIRYRQLVDILGTLDADAQSPVVEAGFAAVEALDAALPAADRVAALRGSLRPMTNARLLARFAEGAPEVACAAIATARLDEAAWLALVPALPVRARGILRHRRDLPAGVVRLLDRLGVQDRVLSDDRPVPSAAAPSVPVPSPAAAPEAPRFAAPTGNLATDQDMSEDVAGLLDLESDPPPPTSLSDWARARAAQQRVQPAPPPPTASTDAGIGAIVRRIEEFRKAREAQGQADSAPDAPRLPLGDLAPATAPRRATAIDFATDAAGRVCWAEGPHAPSVVGLLLTGAATPADAPRLAAALARRLPLVAGQLDVTGAPAVAGAWQVDAAPRFDPVGGRFTGYWGRLRRPAAPAQPARAAEEGDRLRQVLHELRTPANAIQVAAEIIQQQLYGPAPHEYRALAAAIAGDCAHILAGFEELDRLARLETGAMTLEPGECDLGDVLRQTVARLRAWTEPRRSGFALPIEPAPGLHMIALDRGEAERLMWRLFAVMAGAMAPGEWLTVSCADDGGRLTLEIALPAAMAAREGETLSAAAGERGPSLAAGMFGAGFSLRLAAAETAAAGGVLARADNALRLALPALTAADAGHSTLATGSP